MEKIDQKISIAVPNLDETCNVLGYEITREKWQELCKERLLAGKDQFNSWQSNLEKQQQQQQQYPLICSKNPLFFTWDISYFNDAGHSGSTVQPNEGIVIDLSNLVFENGLRLEGYEFRYAVWFGGATFNGAVNFKNAIFHKNAYFLGVDFRDFANFSAITSHEAIDFSYSTFRAGATFFESIIKNAAIFSHSNFESHAVFSKSKFRNLLEFRSVEFLDYTEFYCTEFDDRACFDGATFNKEANFAGKVYIYNNVKTDDKLQTFNSISFSGTHFKNRAVFNNRDFRGTTSFGRYKGQPTKFDLAPLFHNCKLFHGTTFVDAEFETSENDEEAAQAFNTLKLAMSQQQSTRDEHNFIKRELDVELIKAKRRSGKRLLYILYKEIADYGFSAQRPFYWLLLGPSIIFGLCYGLLISWNNCNSISLLFSDSCSLDTSLVIQTIKFTLLQGLPPLGLDKYSYDISNALFSAEKAEPRVPVMILIIMQKIMALAGWFFVALALRNLFKMK
jgi:hypothetical protein